ncbi:metallophosphoesterase family protein [Allorhizobium undicola]|uniref:metallophosphoesterase family protein n=1 Tax=Allorhizobium undicola TaxID=78527 RepID=UPI003D33040E
MRFAAIADIHGNNLALMAVLHDIRQNGIGMEAVVNLGDCFSGPLDTAGTAETLCSLPIVTVRGNHDRYLIEQSPERMGPSDREAFSQLQPHHLDWIRTLPVTSVWRQEVFLCHAMPAADDVYWLEAVTPEGVVHLRPRTEIEAAASALLFPLILCGHSHIPRAVQLSDGRLIVNPGSVGCPAYDDDLPVHHRVETGNALASYAILEKHANGWSVTFRAIPYDHHAMADLAAQRGRQEWQKALSGGWLQQN